jgi:hypothetical protein
MLFPTSIRDRRRALATSAATSDRLILRPAPRMVEGLLVQALAGLWLARHAQRFREPACQRAG